MKEATRSHQDVLSGAVLFLVSVLYFMDTRGLPAGKGEPGPAFFPVLLSCALGILGLSILIQDLTKRTHRTEESKGNRQHTLWKAGLAVVVTALYVSFFQTLGFLLSTWLYALSVTVLFRRDRVLEPAVVPIVSTVLLYLLFQVGLGVRLPPGPVVWP